MRRRGHVWSGAVVVSLAVVACGGTSNGSSRSPSPSTSPTQPKVGFIRSADALCSAAGRQLAAVTPPSTLPEIASSLETSIRVSEDLQNNLRGLTPPPGDAAVVGRILDDFDAVLAQARVARQKALAGDQTATDVAVKQLTPLVQRSGRDAMQYGLKTCGSAAETTSPGAAPQ